MARLLLQALPPVAATSNAGGGESLAGQKRAAEEDSPDEEACALSGLFTCCCVLSGCGSVHGICRPPTHMLSCVSGAVGAPRPPVPVLCSLISAQAAGSSGRPSPFARIQGSGAAKQQGAASQQPPLPPQPHAPPQHSGPAPVVMEASAVPMSLSSLASMFAGSSTPLTTADLQKYQSAGLNLANFPSLPSVRPCAISLVPVAGPPLSSVGKGRGRFHYMQRSEMLSRPIRLSSCSSSHTLNQPHNGNCRKDGLPCRACHGDAWFFLSA